MSYPGKTNHGHIKPMLRAATSCWRATRGFREHRALAGYMARRALERAGFTADEREPCSIRLDGLELCLQPGSGELFLYHEIFHDLAYERHPAFVLRPGWSVLDCGANIGMFSLRAARAGCSQIFALEPDPNTFRRLALNLERNGAGVTALCSAVGRETGRAVFERNEVSTLGRLIPHDLAAASVPSDVVDVITLADAFDRFLLRRVDLLKLDIEGAEYEALEGARPVLDRIERIVMEYHSAERLADCERLLRENGFKRVALAAPSYAYFARAWIC